MIVQDNRPLNKARVRALANSIKEVGLINPITVSPKGKKYILAAGLHRLEACKFLGWKSIPATTRKMDDLELMSVRLAENMQREDITRLQAAKEATRLMAENCDAKYVARVVGKTEDWVIAHTRFPKLTPAWQLLFNRRPMWGLDYAVTLSEFPHSVQTELYEAHKHLDIPPDLTVFKERIERLVVEVGNLTECEGCPERIVSKTLRYNLVGKALTTVYCPKRECHQTRLLDEFKRQLEKTKHDNLMLFPINSPASLSKDRRFGRWPVLQDDGNQGLRDYELDTLLAPPLPNYHLARGFWVNGPIAGSVVEIYAHDKFFAQAQREQKRAWEAKKIVYSDIDRMLHNFGATAGFVPISHKQLAVLAFDTVDGVLGEIDVQKETGNASLACVRGLVHAMKERLHAWFDEAQEDGSPEAMQRFCRILDLDYTDMCHKAAELVAPKKRGRRKEHGQEVEGVERGESDDPNAEPEKGDLAGPGDEVQ